MCYITNHSWGGEGYSLRGEVGAERGEGGEILGKQMTEQELKEENCLEEILV